MGRQATAPGRRSRGGSQVCDRGQPIVDERCRRLDTITSAPPQSSESAASSRRKPSFDPVLGNVPVVLVAPVAADVPVVGSVVLVGAVVVVVAGTAGVTAADAADTTVPSSKVAVTLKVYGVPLVRPVIVQVVSVVVAHEPPGVPVTT